MLYPDNIGPHLCIDESSLSCGELYTFVTNPEGHGGKGTLVAAIKGTKSENVIAVLEKIPCAKRRKIREITLDLSPTMMLIGRTVFPNAKQINDRFHVHKLFYEAIDDLRITLRWMARDLENRIMAECKKEGREYIPFRYANGDTRKQLLARAKFILTKHSSKWTKAQQWRANSSEVEVSPSDVTFERYVVSCLSHSCDDYSPQTYRYNIKVEKTLF